MKGADYLTSIADLNNRHKEVVIPQEATEIWKNQNKLDPKEQERFINCENLVKLWTKELNRHDKEPSVDDMAFVYELFYSWQKPDKLERPVIVQAQPGFGKSVALKVYLRYMTRHDPLFGAVIVKEKLEDLEEVRDYINLDYIEGGNNTVFKNSNYAYLIYGYDYTKMTKEWHSKQFITQINFPVVLMTTKQFQLQAQKKNLGEFKEFIRHDKAKSSRDLMIVDERPEFTVEHRLDTDKLSDILNDIRKISKQANGKVQNYYKKMKKYVDKIRDRMENVTSDGVFELEPLENIYNLPVYLLRDFKNYATNEQLTNVKALEHIIQNGGLFSLNNYGEVIISATQRIDYEMTSYRPFILDGTGEKDIQYLAPVANENFKYFLFKPIKDPDYSNVTFHINKEYSLSKTAIRNTDDFINRAANMIRDIKEKHQNKTLVTIYKELIDKTEEALKPEIERGEIQLKHFDSGRGSNEFKEANTAIYIGVLFKGHLYYQTTAQSIISDIMSLNLGHQFKITKDGFRFEDRETQEISQKDQANTMIQEAHRLRMGDKTEPVNIYLFHKDPEVIDEIIDSFPGAKVKEFSPSEKLTGKKDHTDKLIKFFREMPAGRYYKGSEIQKSLNLNKVTFSRLVNSNRVKETMKSFGVKKEKTKFIKE